MFPTWQATQHHKTPWIPRLSYIIGPITPYNSLDTQCLPNDRPHNTIHLPQYLPLLVYTTFNSTYSSYIYMIYSITPLPPQLRLTSHDSYVLPQFPPTSHKSHLPPPTDPTYYLLHFLCTSVPLVCPTSTMHVLTTCPVTLGCGWYHGASICPVKGSLYLLCCLKFIINSYNAFNYDVMLHIKWCNNIHQRALTYFLSTCKMTYSIVKYP